MASLNIPSATARALGWTNRTNNVTAAPGTTGTTEAEKLRQAAKGRIQTSLESAANFQPSTQTATLGAQVAQQAQGLTFDRAGLETTLIGEIDREAQLAKERLARQYGIDPGGSTSGMSQRAFETLEGQVIGSKAETRATLLQQEAEQLRANLAATQSAYAALSGQELAAAGQRLAGAQAAGQQLTAEEELLLQTWQAQESADQAWNQTEMGWAQITGRAPLDVSADMLGVDLSGVPEGALATSPQYQAAAQNLIAQAESRGVNLTSLDIEKLMRGETVRTLQETVAGRQATTEETTAAQTNAIRLAELLGRYTWEDGATSETLAAQSQRVMLAIQQAQLTGTFRQEISLASLGLTYDGSAASMYAISDKLTQLGISLTEEESKALLAGSTVYRTDLTLEAELADMQRRIEEASLTGTYTDAEGNELTTLQSQLQAAQLQLQRDTIALQREQLAAEQFRFVVGETGVIGQNGEVSLSDLGVDASGIFDEDGNYLPGSMERMFQVVEQVSPILASLGVSDITDDQFLELLKGGTISTESSLTLSAKQGLLDQARLAMERTATEARTELDGLVAKAAATGYWDTVATLERMQYETATEIQREELNLKWTGELSRQAQVQAELTGTYGGGLIGLQDLGLETLRYKADGTLADGETAKYQMIADTLSDRFMARAGRAPTEAELNALIRGQKVDLEGTQTLAQRQLGLQEALARAEQTGTYVDPLTGKSYQTLLAERQQFDQQLATQQQNFTEMMALAEQTGYISLGSGGVISALDLGVDTTYTSQIATNELSATPEWQRLKDNYYAITGKTLSDADATKLLKGQTFDTGLDDIRVETAATRAQNRQLAITEGTALGELYGRQTEAARQFDAQLAMQTDLSAAEVQKIYADISRADRELNQRIFEFSSASTLQFAELFGTVGSSGSITAEQLGVASLEEMLPGETLDQWFTRVDNSGAARDALRATLESLGETVTDEMLGDLLSGKAVQVSGQKTLGALTLAAQVSEQNLNRATDLLKFSQTYDLDERRFAQATEESDRNYALAAEQVANDYGLEVDKFLLAKTQMDATLSGRLGFNGPMTLSDLRVTAPEPTGQIGLAVTGYDMDDVREVMEYRASSGQWYPKAGKEAQFTAMISAIKSYVQENSEQLGLDPNTLDFGKIFSSGALKPGVQDAEYMQKQADYMRRIQNNFSMVAGRAPSATELQSILNGGTVQITTQPTFAMEQWLATTQQQADAFGLEVDKFREASQQFDRSFTQAEATTYSQLFGTDQDDPSQHTIEYQKYLDAKTDFDETEIQRDMLWTEMLKSFGKKETSTLDGLYSAGIVNKQAMDQAVAAAAPYETLTLNTLGLDANYLNDMKDAYKGSNRSFAMQGVGDYVKSAYGIILDMSQLHQLFADQGVIVESPTEKKNAQIAYLKSALQDYYGYEIDDVTINSLISNPSEYVGTFKRASFGPEELSTLANFINGHASAVAQNNTGYSGLAQLGGAIVGGTLGFVASGGNGAIAASAAAAGANTASKFTS